MPSASSHPDASHSNVSLTPGIKSSATKGTSHRIIIDMSRRSVQRALLACSAKALVQALAILLADLVEILL
jgi:hypothetical protein